jgi:hypothetical protein
LLGLVLAACGGETPPPQTADNTPPPAETTAADTPASTEPSGAGDEAWEGEKEATAAAGSGDAKEAQDAPPDTKKTETRTMEVIQKIVKDNRQPVRECFNKAKKDLPDLAGTMTIHFVLDPEGKIKKAELNQERSTLKAPTVVTCAIDHLKTIKFPPSSRGMETDVNYPFGFEK